MASRKSIAIRREQAIQAIEQALGQPVQVRHRDRDMAEALTLEAIAEALQGMTRRKATTRKRKATAK